MAQPLIAPEIRDIREGPNREFVVNPRTGNRVRADGRIGRAVLNAHRIEMEGADRALPRGILARRVVPAARPGPVIRGYFAPRVARAIGAYRVQAFNPAGRPATTVARFAQEIAATLANVPNAFQVMIRFLDPDERAVWRTVSAGTARHMLERIDSLQNGAYGQSDAVYAEGLLDTSEFQIGSRVHPNGGATLRFSGISKVPGRKSQFFKLVDFSGKAKNGDCLLAVLRAVAKEQGCLVPKERNDALRRRCGIPPGNIDASPANMTALANAFGLRIRVITGMAVPPDAERVYDDSQARLIGRNLCKTVPEMVQIANAGAADAPPCDVYLADQHYEYIQRVLEPIKTCPITGDIISVDDKRSAAAIRRRVVEQGRTWYADRKVADAPEKPKKVVWKERVIVYDYETIYTGDGTLEPYALGYIAFNPEEETHDFSELEARVVQVIRRPGESAYRVSAPLLDELAAAPPDVRYTLVSFNGAKFDHFILADAANNRGYLSKLFATAGGGLRSLTLMQRHDTLDLAKLIPAMSLAKACQGFQTSPTKMDGFSHVEIQREYEAGKLYDWLAANRGRLSDYLARDVLSESSLFQRLAVALPSLTGKAIYGAKAVQTIGSHAWALMSETCPLPRRVESEELDRHIRTAIVGGRVQVYKDEHDPAEGPARIIDEQLNMLDFASLYPTAMAAVDKAASVFDPSEMWGVYPSGAENAEPHTVEAWTPGEIGIYSITVHEQPPGLPNVLPNRGETLDWGDRGEFDTMATHIDLALIQKGGGRFTVHSGHVWPVHKRGLFRDFILPLAARKDEQDALEKAGDPSFNPAMRMALKLLMNSASGKLCQSNYEDEITLATGSVAQLAADSKMSQDHPRTWIPLGAETCIIIGKKPLDKVYKKNAKPSIMAVLVYAYSRALVWRTLCQHNVLYSDTDSGLFRAADCLAIRRAFPQLDPTGRRKELGDLEEELKPHARAVAYRIAPKDYAVFLYDADDKLIPNASKIRVKGINMRSDRLITDEEHAGITGAGMPELTEAYHGGAGAAIGRPLSDIAIAKEFYDIRSQGTPVRVLSSQIVRSYRDEAAPLKLVQRYLVKKL